MYCPNVFGDGFLFFPKSRGLGRWNGNVDDWTQIRLFRRCELGAFNVKFSALMFLMLIKFQISIYKFRSKSMDKSSSWNHCWGIVTQAKKQICLGGGFKYFLCSSLPGENDPIWRAYFSWWVGSAPGSNGVDSPCTLPGLSRTFRWGFFHQLLRGDDSQDARALQGK